MVSDRKSFTLGFGQVATIVSPDWFEPAFVSRLCPALIDSTGFTPEWLAKISRTEAAKFCIFSNSRELPDLVEFMAAHPGVRSVVGHNQKYFRQEVMASVSGIRGEHFDGSFYGEGARIRDFQVPSAKEHNRILDEIEGILAARQFPETVRDRVSSVAWELMMNASNDATMLGRAAGDTGGEVLPVEVTCAISRRQISLCVTDFYGTLKKEAIIANLKRAASGGEEQVATDGITGAGIGLYMVANSCHRLSYWVTPGLCTKVVVTFYRCPDEESFESRFKSINFFY